MQGDLFERMVTPPPIRDDGIREDVAAFSDDEVYRWWLTRNWSATNCRPLIACGLNPSTATAIKDDRTVAKDVAFAKLWGCGWLGKVNAYGYRTKTPAIMQRARKAGVDIVGADNDRWLRHAFELAVEHRGIILLGWGAHIEPERQREIAELLAATGATGMCLGTNGNGTPTHELYIPYARELVPWVCP